MKPFFRRWWLAILLTPFLSFTLIDLLGYVLKENGIIGFPPLTDILVGYVPMPNLIAETVLLAVAFVLHWIIAKRDLEKSKRERG